MQCYAWCSTLHRKISGQVPGWQENLSNRDGHAAKTDRLARRKSSVQAIKDAHLVGAMTFSVEIEGHGRAVTAAKLAAPARGGTGFQGRGYYFGGHEGARVKQQA